jgi:MFS family permease
MPDVASPANRRLVFASLVLANFALGLEGMIVATAMPSVVSKLGGFNYYTWVVSAFLLAQASTVVIYGKLADLFGRKPVLILGTSIFVLGSLLCGFAGSMNALIGSRLIQGLGAGAAGPIMITIIGDLYTLEERARPVAILSSTSLISSLLGPAAGSLLVTRLSWHWVFWCTVPLGIITIVCLAIFLRESIETRKPYIDYGGAILFFISVGALILFFNKQSPVLAVTCIGAGVLFIIHEKKVPEPMVSFELWTRKLVAACSIANHLAFLTLSVLGLVLPIYLQGVQGHSPLTAGLTITALVFGNVGGLFLSNRLRRMVGTTRTSYILTPALPIGAIGLLFLTPSSSPIYCAAINFLVGVGICPLFLFGLATVQSSVDWATRGSATACVLFCATLGSILGTTILQATIDAGISHYAPGALSQAVHDLLDQPGGLTQLASSPTARPVLDNALHWSFIAVLLFATLTLIATWSIPMEDDSDLSERSKSPDTAPPHASSGNSATWRDGPLQNPSIERSREVTAESPAPGDRTRPAPHRPTPPPP